MAAREVLARFGIEVDTGKLDAAKKGVEGMANGLREFGKLLAGAAIVNGIRNFVASVTGTDAALLQTSRRLGVNTRELQQWQTAVQLSGASAEDASAAIGAVKKALDAASLAGASSSAAFAGLGINIRDASGKVKATNTVMREVVGSIVAIPDPIRRAQRATQVFGDAGAKLGPMFAKGKAGVGGLLAELDKLGGGMSGDALKATEAYNQQMAKWEIASTGVKSAVATQLLPVLTRFATGVTKLVAVFNHSEEGSKRLKTALQTLGVIAFAAGVKMALPYIGTLLAIGAVILIVDDLKTALEGGDSATGALLDRLFGKGAAQSIFKTIKADLEDYSRAAAKEKDLTGKALAVIEEFLSKVGEDLVKFFVDDLPEAIKLAKDQLTEKVKSTIVTAIDGAKVAAKAKVEEFKQVGKDYINGLIEGIKDATGITALQEATGKVVGSGVIDAAKKRLEEKSPSKAGERSGRNYVKGMGGGVEREIASLESTVSAKIQSVVRVGDRAMRTINAPHTYNNQITISGTGPHAVRQGLAMAREDDSRASLAALEATA